MPFSPQDRDLLVRTVMGEANREPDAGQVGVAAVVLNRLKSGRYGPNMASVLFAPKQFEPWNTRRQELLGFSPQSPAYQRAAQNVDRLLSGQTGDPTRGAVNFQNPVTVAGRGNRSGMSWYADMVRNGSATRIGNHVFGSPGDSPGASSAPFKGTAGGTGAYDFAATVRPGAGDRAMAAMDNPIGANPLPQTPEAPSARPRTIGDVFAEAMPAMFEQASAAPAAAAAPEAAARPQFERVDPATIIGPVSAPLRGRIGQGMVDPNNAALAALPRLGDAIFG